MHCTESKTVTARKAHQCTSCGEGIAAGESYEMWISFDDSVVTIKMHPECRTAHQDKADATGDGGAWEYSHHGHERGLSEEK